MIAIFDDPKKSGGYDIELEIKSNSESIIVNVAYSNSDVGIDAFTHP